MVTAVAWLVDDGLGDGGVEGLADRIDPHEALLLERAEQRRPDRLDLRGAMGNGRVARVEHREQALDEPPDDAGDLSSWRRWDCLRKFSKSAWVRR